MGPKASWEKLDNPFDNTTGHCHKLRSFYTEPRRSSCDRMDHLMLAGCGRLEEAKPHK